MPTKLDATHDPKRRSWVESANAADTEFPIQNLPYCVFRPRGSNAEPHIGVGIGTQIFDLTSAAKAGLLEAAGEGALAACRVPLLNALMALGPPVWRHLRRAISDLLATEAPADLRREAAGKLVEAGEADFLMHTVIGDFSDFFASIIHATNAGRLFRPDNPLLPNYKWVPVAYHSRTSSISVSGTAVRRPSGQTKAPDAGAPVFGPCRRLDYEAELGFFVGPGNALGTPIPIGEADAHIFGVSLLNDWSARDIQAWEYQPLGPFLAKSFASTLSPWVVTMDALAPFRTSAFERPAGDPRPLPHLFDQGDQASGAFDIDVDVFIETEAMRSQNAAPHRLSQARFADTYWTVAQMVAHQTSNGCNVRPGDLIGSGTVSSREPGASGCLLELTGGGANPLSLPGGEKRAFLENGDRVILRARAAREGFVAIGFGECSALIEPAL